jgi:hypothetical protein
LPYSGLGRVPRPTRATMRLEPQDRRDARMGRDRITGHTGKYVDQVLRKERFMRANPSVEIMSPRQLGGNEWVSTWDEERGSTTIHRFELREVLDVLEERFGIPGDIADE